MPMSKLCCCCISLNKLDIRIVFSEMQINWKLLLRSAECECDAPRVFRWLAVRFCVVLYKATGLKPAALVCYYCGGCAQRRTRVLSCASGAHTSAVRLA